ncbi:tRNA (cytidine/uridine-2'-O-)-methyltransferase [Actinobaculum suis]|uniref:Putative tRNA (cytidine(34)-2'-O)-methyltransferase n=1 Tax=Actinobaculum suis TaxID=1657 RepID=A0A0K9ES72_9ACTO|nr:tRNA (cytidine(34)-2'-O)-methyltransferase [Actinobaculum suis]KMY22657.1 RNA methyltransferase [Actinobaculum suis]MDY5153046.1 tRNA (cytidine(34)-2'-O)-methyltransferase [Actinobaculum suis]OCA93713.1 tRNA (cytosine(34)-2'-O)-methyltransferase TrmL [Actinobaculum suis]OCA94006.1 tRNA (cytosine(34)-2'-O)-methyltransferase TrmL [Actinobaculum suis]SDE61035.1 tRNA (cytidine/uridine-2'-O-)-methyltransferase [Actinobaculum suis]
MLNIVFFEPRIPGNTGAAIRLAACTGATLHLIKPLGFDFSDAHLKRAGLDYHDLADLVIHENFQEFCAAVGDARIFAFTGHSSRNFATVSYRTTDYLLFGPEPTGLPPEVLDSPAITAKVRIPMKPHLRSLNLANSASIAVYEAWRQLGYAGSIDAIDPGSIE